MKKTIALASVVIVAVSGSDSKLEHHFDGNHPDEDKRDLHKLMKGVDPKTWKSHPKVQATSFTCATTVNRLK